VTLLRGTRLGHYEITAILGSGGMGEVYRARDDRLQRDVAIKVLPHHLASDDEALGRFQREARAVAALTHPNIRAIFDFDVENDMPYAVGELLQGSTLRAVMSKEKMPITRCIAIAAAISDGLAAAHAKGIIHRDIKPENVFITDENQVKILDFGLARTYVPNKSDGSNPTASAYTEPGTAVGTIGYMAPEQIRGRACDATCDLFSLGCVLYEMLTGTSPFAGDSHAETTAAVLRDTPRPPEEIRPEISETLADVVMRCLEKDPTKRYATAIEVGDVLRHMELTAPTERHTVRARAFRRTVRRARIRFAVMIAGVIALASAFTYAYTSQRGMVIDTGYALQRSDVTASGDALRLLRAGLRADAEGNRLQATEMLQEAARLDPIAPLPRAFLASFEEAAGNHTAAEGWAKGSMRAMNDSSPPYEALLVRYLTLPALRPAAYPLGATSSLLELRPGAWRLRLGLAHLRLSKRELAAALQELQRIDVTKVDDRRVALVIADRASLGDIAGAEAVLPRSGLLPGSAIELYARARIAWSRGDAHAAVATYDRCVDRATLQNVPDIALEARLLGGMASIGAGRFADAETRLEIAAAVAREAEHMRDEFSANVLAAYAADRNGDEESRDRHLLAADALADEVPSDAVVSMHAMALRMRSPAAAQLHPIRLPPGDRATLGAASFLAAREALRAGDAPRAAKLLREATMQGVESTYLAEDAALLAADLGGPPRKFRADPPYPNLPRFVAVWELERK